MAEPITWTAVAMSAVASGGAWIKIIMDQRKANGKGNGSLPGKAEICIQRGERISKIETDEEWLKDGMRRLEDMVKEIRLAVVK